MKYKFGDSVITSDGNIGIVIQIHEYTHEYFIMFPKGGRTYCEDKLQVWNGCW